MRDVDSRVAGIVGLSALGTVFYCLLTETAVAVPIFGLAIVLGLRAVRIINKK